MALEFLARGRTRAAWSDRFVNYFVRNVQLVARMRWPVVAGDTRRYGQFGRPLATGMEMPCRAAACAAASHRMTTHHRWVENNTSEIIVQGNHASINRRTVRRRQSSGSRNLSTDKAEAFTCLSETTTTTTTQELPAQFIHV